MRKDRTLLFFRSRLLAAKRRLALLLQGDFDPYPAPPEGVKLSPSEHIAKVADLAVLKLDWVSAKSGSTKVWQDLARARLRELLCLQDEIVPASALSESEMPIAEGYVRRRLYVRVGRGSDAPVDIVRRSSMARSKTSRAPVVICMQGTNSGAHLNLGEVRMPADVYKVASGSSLALQAADNGYIAVSFERACFGERRETRLKSRSTSPTIDAAFHSLMLGEALLGQTVAELEALRQWIDADISPGSPVYLAGYSAAGTAAIAAAAAIPEFAGIAVGGCVGMMRDTILRRGASGYNDIPNILEWFEFDALLALIAPRPCLVIAGKKDHIWPATAAEKVVSSARRAWQELDREDCLNLLTPPGGHTYYPELMWPAMQLLVPVFGEDRTSDRQLDSVEGQE